MQDTLYKLEILLAAELQANAERPSVAHVRKIKALRRKLS